jgi:hypothetical protein
MTETAPDASITLPWPEKYVVVDLIVGPVLVVAALR